MSCKAGIGLQHFADGRTGKRAAPIMVPNHGANLRGEIRSKPAWIFSRPALFASEHEFARDPAHIHLVVEIFHRRSEEHTSELQSLMRISYAVFCLKKKNSHNN